VISLLSSYNNNIYKIYFFSGDIKIIHMSDIHGDFESFDKALEIVKTTDADVLAITGDLSGHLFQGEEKEHFAKINFFLNQNFSINGPIHGLAEALASGKIDAPTIKDKSQLIGVGREYLKFEELARERMLSNYNEFKTRFDTLKQKVVLIPGNWDGKYIDDILSQENLHEKSPLEIGDVQFFGYGSCTDIPIFIPRDFLIDYNSDSIFQYLSAQESKDDLADVVLTHLPPRYFEGKNKRTTGDPLTLAYMFRNSPELILCGHTHGLSIIQDNTSSTFVVNPGNLGRYGNDSFGTFLEIDTNKEGFTKPEFKIYQISP
jgi:Icc-related predicted phosphoesterase